MASLQNKGGEEGQGQPQSKFRPLVSEPLTLRRLGQLEFRNLQVLLGEIELRRSELRAGGRGQFPRRVVQSLVGFKVRGRLPEFSGLAVDLVGEFVNVMERGVRGRQVQPLESLVQILQRSGDPVATEVDFRLHAPQERRQLRNGRVSRANELRSGDLQLRGIIFLLQNQSVGDVGEHRSLEHRALQAHRNPFGSAKRGFRFGVSVQVLIGNPGAVEGGQGQSVVSLVDVRRLPIVAQRTIIVLGLVIDAGDVLQALGLTA